MTLRKKSFLVVTSLLLLGVGFGYAYVEQTLNFTPQTDAARIAIRAEVSAQDETAFYQPPQSPLSVKPVNPVNNVYFGDLHIHSSLSADAYLFGNRRDLDATYQFAKGESAELATGEVIGLTRPLDFAAVTDHAEGFGLVTTCIESSNSDIGEACELIERPNIFSFLTLRASVEARPLVKDLRYFANDRAQERRAHFDTWSAIVAAAERHNEPGVFTAFAGYEYSCAVNAAHCF